MRRGRILILVGLLLACGTAAVIFLLLQNVTKQTPGEQVVKEAVVVASQPMAEGDLVDGRLEIKEMPKEAIPETALRTLDGTTGMLATTQIDQGTIVLPSMMQTKQQQMQEGQLGQLVEPGFIAVDLPITELSSVSYGIIPDDRVDILMTFSFIDIDQENQIQQPMCPPSCPSAAGQATTAGGAQIPRRVAQVILQDVRVLGIGRWTYGVPTPAPQATPQAKNQQAAQATPPEYITVMLKAQDALVLKLARESGAFIDLAVRAKDDHEKWTTDQVTLQYMIDHYGFGVPGKQNYTLETLTGAAPAAP